jgi:antitoxin CcdA
LEDTLMTISTSPTGHTRKRAVQLILSEELVEHARHFTPDLSGIVETLLTRFVAEEQLRHETGSRHVKETIALWNAFDEQHGSFADEYSTL